MTDYTKSTGSTGTMLIRDTGTTIEFWLKAGSGTFHSTLPWSYVVNGVTSATQTFNFVSGGAYQKLRTFTITSTQTVSFKLGATGTSGLGGPTTFSQLITRSTIPATPPAPIISNVGSTTLDVAFGIAEDDGGSPITEKQIGYGTSSSSPSTTITSDGTTTITGLTPGTVYYFWVRLRNANGYSSWSPRVSVTTTRVPDAPRMIGLSGIGPTSILVLFEPNGDGGSPILQYRVWYGTSETIPTFSWLASASPKNITGLQPGTKYYFWVEAQNAVGWSPRSSSASSTTIAGVRIKVGSVWKVAVPYVRQGGVWKLASPWVRVMGVWKKTI